MSRRLAHCIAPDLIGFGQSGKPEIDYRFVDHVRYLDAFIAEAGITSAYLVAQDWGTALAFHLAARRPDFVRGLAFMEFIRPMATWDDFHQVPAAARDLSQVPDARCRRIHDPRGQRLRRTRAARLDRAKLSDEEMAVYRAPFPTPESRRPTWRLPNELPIAGAPADVHTALQRAHDALASSRYPKLLFVGDPGALVSPAFAEHFAARLQQCTIVRLGAGHHYLQEDHPEQIGRSVATWIAAIEAAGRGPGCPTIPARPT